MEGNRVVLLFITFLETRECLEKVGRTRNGLVSTFPYLHANNAENSHPYFFHQNKGFIKYVFFRNWAVKNTAGTRLHSLAR